ncbi:acylphosphatase [Salinicoccus albus]|uniref:acylphosphatase n=1 Tax=Salinicoccus albus TaxID=418756 RepID=UPI0003794902|nr:acylphosphatase [Salinicoccus albus]
MENQNQLFHLKNSLPADVIKHQTSFYTVALEAWRRGMRVKYFNSKRGGRVPSTSITYSLSDGVNEYHFVCARGTKTTKEAISKAENKGSAYKHMRAQGLPVPESRTFNYNESSIGEMCTYGESIGYPLVIKPTDRGGGRGVVTHINSKDMLKDSLIKVKNDFKPKEIIIEKYFEGGVDYRFYVIQDKVIAVSKSYSSNVIGNGRSNMKELIKKRNIEINNNVSTKQRDIKIDQEMKEFLNENNMTLDYIPEEGERVFVRKHGTHLGDRLSVDCTDSIDPKFKKYAVDALNSVPGLPTGSIDMIINEEKNEGIVNEINTKGEIMMHVFPFEGQPVDIPKHLIDFYFPGSKKINDNFYFEYKHVKDLFLSGHADEITIPMFPKGTQYEKQISIKGTHFGPNYLKRLKKKAANLQLKGYISASSKESVEIEAIGNKDTLNSFEEFIRGSSRNRTKVHNVSASEMDIFDGVSSIGFEINDDSLNKIKKKDNDKEKIIKKENEDLSKEILNMKNSYSKKLKNREKRIQELMEELDRVKSSNSWKLTKPLRNIKGKIEK